MAKIDLGGKRVCAECSAKFFDLKKRPVVCPKCSFSFDPDTVSRRGTRKPEPVAEVKQPAESQVETEEKDTEDEDQKELSLDDESLNIGVGSEDTDSGSDSSGGGGLPAGYSEEGVDDETDTLSDNEDEDAKLADQDDLDN